MKIPFENYHSPKTKNKLSLNPSQNAYVGANESYPIIDGIPRFVPENLYKDEKFKGGKLELQTGKSFGDKWREGRYKNYGEKKEDYELLLVHMLEMFNLKSKEELSKLFSSAKRALNGGCGVGWSEAVFNLSENCERHAVDLSLSVEAAYERSKDIHNIHIAQASILELPFDDSFFDVVFSAGVVHHTPNPKGAVQELCRVLEKGGVIGLYIYNKKPFIREWMDEKVREHTTKMNYEECMEFSHQMSVLGKNLQKINETFNLEVDIPLLGMKAGSYNLQRFFYDHVLKCYNNDGHGMEFSDLVNLDWYHPSYASHHSLEEIESWFIEKGVEIKAVNQPDGWEHSGYFIRGEKILNE